MKKYISGILLTAVALNTFGAGSTGFFEVAQVQQRECSESKGFQVVLASAHLNPDQCGSNTTLEIRCDIPAYETHVSMVLTALAAGKKIQAYVSSCDSEGQAKVVALTLQN